jgi:glutamate-1-semialdehyde 2,1-aminomutase
MPIGAYGGKKELMRNLMPLGTVYQAGTFSGNPVTMASAVATLEALSDPSVHAVLTDRANQLCSGLKAEIHDLERELDHALPVQVQNVGSMFSITFAPRPVTNYKDSLAIDVEKFALFFHEMLKRGIMLPPTAQDAACLSTAHSPEDIDATITACSEALRRVFAMAKRFRT